MNRILLTLLSVLLLAGATSAQPEGRGDRGGMPGIEKLNLTAEQKVALKNAVKPYRTQLIDLKADMQKKRLELRDIMDTDNPDRASYEKAGKEMADIEQRMRLTLFDMRAEAMKVLTPEQRAKWNEQRGERMREFGKRPRDRRER